MWDASLVPTPIGIVVERRHSSNDYGEAGVGKRLMSC